MNVLVCSKISIPEKDRTLPVWEYARSIGHTITVEHSRNVANKPDVIISMGVASMEETFEALGKFPTVPLFCYNWDCYEWVWSNPRPGEYNYHRYGQLLKRAREVWVPSECTRKRTKQWWGIDSQVVLSAVPYWDYDNVRDDGYAYCALREIPDRHWGLFEEACGIAGIPCKMTEHKVSYEKYQDVLAGCSFIVAPLYELSTGGLSLLEAYYLGKPCIISNSEWNGGVDYLGQRAMYFESGNAQDLARVMSLHATSYVQSDHAGYVRDCFPDSRMIDDMFERIRLRCQ